MSLPGCPQHRRVRALDGCVVQPVGYQKSAVAAGEHPEQMLDDAWDATSKLLMRTGRHLKGI
jgi:hypothetical protein